MASGASGDDVLGSNADITGTGITDLTLDGDDDVFKGSASGLDVSGTSSGDDIYLSNTTIDVTGNNSSVDIFGSNDRIVGATDDTFNVTGGDDSVDATDSDINFDGSYSGDTIAGSGDDGSYGSSGGSGGDGGGGGEYGGYYGFTTWKGKAPTATIANQYAGKSGTVYEKAAWADKTLTWSFAAPTQGVGSTLSDAISDPSQQAAVEQAFQTWAQASGLNLMQVASGKSADIEVGFGDLDTSTTNQIGVTHLQGANGNLTGALVELEDPSQSPLTTDSNGQLAYANTDATFEQVVLHEIGHALGLADSDQAGSIMNYLLDGTDASLGSMDLAGISNLYGYGSNTGTVAAQASASGQQWSQLVQAMATFGGESMGETGTAAADMDLYKPQLAVALHAQAA
nr:matrixin family metalloprotease [Rhodanobacter sp. DHB23]